MGDASGRLGRAERRPRRLLVVMPSWLGDAVMATPTLRLVRDALPGAYIGGLMRPGLDELLAGTRFFDEVHVGHSQGVMGPKRLAAKVRGRGYDTALLLTNSFSTALAMRLAFIPRRVGYDRDGRGLLLTERVKPERRADGRYACMSAVGYYLKLASEMLGGAERVVRLELGLTPEQEAAAGTLLERAGVRAGDAYAVVNPGANDAAKRWPAERFGAVAVHLSRARGWKVLVNGSPGEAGICEEVVGESRKQSLKLPKSEGETGQVVALPRLGVTIGALKGVVRGARVMVTNDTGPRHIAAAFGVPTVTLFGPTDPRWTTLPPAGAGGARRVDVMAEPDLPVGEIADDHKDLCRIDRIAVERVIGAVEEVLEEGLRA